MVDDGCVTEESYDAGTYESCYGELIDHLFVTALLTAITISGDLTSWIHSKYSGCC